MKIKTFEQFVSTFHINLDEVGKESVKQLANEYGEYCYEQAIVDVQDTTEIRESDDFDLRTANKQ